MTNKVLYVSYGTNMDFERFLLYILGGTLPGSDKTYEGCRDQTLPEAKFILANDEVQAYYARNSSPWGPEPFDVKGSEVLGGLGVLAYVDRENTRGLRIVNPEQDSLVDIINNDEAIMMSYLITRQQFGDLMAQENKRPAASPDQDATPYKVGDIELPDALFESLNGDNRLINLRDRIGHNAIVLPDGEKLEIDVAGAYSAMMYLGEVEVDGEMVKAITFTTPLSYERAAAQTYVNMAIGSAGTHDNFVNAELKSAEVLYSLFPNVPTDQANRLNPAAAKYVQMVASGIIKNGGGKGDWTRDNAIEYSLSKPPFSKGQIPEFADMVRDYLSR